MQSHATHTNRHAPSYSWAGAEYVNLHLNEQIEVDGHEITLTDMQRQWCTLDVDGQSCKLEVARLALPQVVKGLRLFIADNRPVASLTDDAALHSALTGDALLCVSDAEKPLLDPDRFTFPVSRRDGYEWKQLEDSHMYAYLGPRWNDKTKLRSHEGVDLDLHEARGIEKHPIVAIEDAKVAWVRDYREADPDHREACVCLQSEREPDIWYINTHLHNRTVVVEAGQRVKRGDMLGYIWGDGVWGHLHFSVVHRNEEPPFHDRYRRALNTWPGLCELWHGTLDLKPLRRTSADLIFGPEKGPSGNFKLADAYAPVRGLGWLVADWCAASRVETFSDPNDREQGYACLTRTLFPGKPAEATNPEDHYTFAVDVEPGQYEVKAQVGDWYNPSWQRVELNGVDAGTFDLGKGETTWTESKRVEPIDGQLQVRLHLRDAETIAGLCRLTFNRVG